MGVEERGGGGGGGGCLQSYSYLKNTFERVCKIMGDPEGLTFDVNTDANTQV